MRQARIARRGARWRPSARWRPAGRHRLARCLRLADRPCYRTWRSTRRSAKSSRCATRFSDWVGGDLDARDGAAVAAFRHRARKRPQERGAGRLLAEPALDRRANWRRSPKPARRTAAYQRRLCRTASMPSSTPADLDSRFRLRNELFLTQKQAARKQLVTNAVLAEHPDADRLGARRRPDRRRHRLAGFIAGAC